MVHCTKKLQDSKTLKNGTLYQKNKHDSTMLKSGTLYQKMLSIQNQSIFIILIRYAKSGTLYQKNVFVRKFAEISNISDCIMGSLDLLFPGTKKLL